MDTFRRPTTFPLRRSRWALAMVLAALVAAPACKPTYKKATVDKSVQTLAKKEYGLDVDVQEAGNTLGVRFQVPNLLSALFSGDDEIYKKINGLLTILARVSLSIDQPPDFVVLTVSDAQKPGVQLVFTRYVEDIRKSMAEALSTTEFRDRVLQELVIGGKRMALDPNEMDLVRLMMLAIDADEEPAAQKRFSLQPVRMPEFIAGVLENTMRRVLREQKDFKKEVLLRDVTAGTPEESAGQFKVLLDLVSQPATHLSPNFVDEKVLPIVAKQVTAILKSYRFTGARGVTVIEKNSGKMLTVPAH